MFVVHFATDARGEIGNRAPLQKIYRSLPTITRPIRMHRFLLESKGCVSDSFARGAGEIRREKFLGRFRAKT